MKDLIPNLHAHTRSVDEYCNISAVERPRGHGGVATLWSERLNLYARRCDEGNERVLVTCFEIPDNPICCINCYLPSGNSAAQAYAECIDILHEVITKYSQSHLVLIAGDLNADIMRRESIKERLLKDLINEHSLHVTYSDDRPLELFSYRHNSVRDTSLLDYILLGGRTDISLEPLSTVTATIHEHSPVNSSTHTAVSVKLQLKDPRSTSSRKNKQVVHRQTFMWAKADLEAYKAAIQAGTSDFNTDLLNTEDAISILQHIIQTALFTAVPVKTVKLNQNLKKKKVWSPEVKAAALKSKQLFLRWKLLGRPSDHQANHDRREATRVVRRVQRSEAELTKNMLYEEIMDSANSDHAKFYKIIKCQRVTAQSAPALRINGDICTDPLKCVDALANHYEGLATPSNPGTYDDTFLAQVHKDIAHMLQLIPQSHLQLAPDAVTNAISKLNTGKSPDSSGIKAEYLKAAASELNPVMSTIFARIYKERAIPNNMKSGFKVSIPKKNKDALIPTNHRGIAITSTIGKVFEHSLSLDIKEAKLLPQHSLQYGFTKGRSPNMAALGLTESHAEAEDLGLSTLVSTIDAQKAFDVVSQEVLLHKLHNKLPADIWMLIKSLHSDCKESVRWQGENSREYTVKQGIRQGGILSTELYKQYIDGLLHSMEELDLGVRIGTTYMGTPTCCDDILLLARETEELQAMLDCCDAFANKHRYTINPSKSTITNCTSRKSKDLKSDTTWKLGESKVPVTATYTHLGLERSATRSTPDVKERVKSSRRSAYALMGAGLHGQGLNHSRV